MHTGTLVLLLAALLSTSCKDEPSKAASALCQDAIARGRSLLAVPDIEAARDWLAQAKTRCGADVGGEVASLEQDINASVRRKAEAEERRRRDLEPPPPRPSLVPEIVALTDAYRGDSARRTKCDQQADDNPLICESTRSGAGVQVNVATMKRDATAYSVFASLLTEVVDCAAFGPHEVKRTWKHGGDQLHTCVLTSAPLGPMMVFIQQHLNGSGSDVTLFTKSWTKYDIDLAVQIAQAGDP